MITDDLVALNCSSNDRISTDYVILHATAGGSYSGARAAYESRKVSAHYTIDSSGKVYRNVVESRVAWHAGQSKWGSLEMLNPHSIGIEMIGWNRPDSSYPAAQVQALASLVRDICKRHSISWRDILTHAMISPGRKTDPANFDAYTDILASVAADQISVARAKVIVQGDTEGSEQYERQHANRRSEALAARVRLPPFVTSATAKPFQ